VEVAIAHMTGSALRCALAHHARRHAEGESIPYRCSYGDAPAVCFLPYDGDLRHGNFLDSSYKAIQAKPEWRKRLSKVHTQGTRSLPRTERGRWMELDSCMSSDALLMNIFCHPGTLRNGVMLTLLGVESGATPIFGYKACVPLANGRVDRTEVDMRFGNVLMEAKLTESDFQRTEKKTLLAYRDFVELFDWQELPQTGTCFASYQLIRNVLAAFALDCSLCILIDARRADLYEHWYAVMRCVKPIALRTRLRICTWQELAGLTRPRLREFLRAKYGID